jgi:mono/diheme cytochrome c family protein
MPLLLQTAGQGCARTWFARLDFYRRLPRGILFLLATALPFGLWGLCAAWASGGGRGSLPGPNTEMAGTASTLFLQLCQRCHAASGKGDRRAGVSGLPNFTDSDWQTRRTDPQLLVSILDGRGDAMPSFRGRVTEAHARALVDRIRAFGPKRAAAQSTSDFAIQFRELDRELQDLKRQLKALTASPPDPEKRTAAPRRQDPHAVRQVILKSGGELFRKHCQRCHGADGKGDGGGNNGPPDFTRRAWQQRRSDAKLLSSILDGKGKDMPAFRKRFSEDQATDLIDYIRAFMPPRQPVPMTPRSRDTDQGRPPR